MTDYKTTLNLPKTAFPMKANLAQREPKMLEHWQSINLYDKVREASKGRDPFILYDGPPYANGPIHNGHGLNKTLKDMIIKSKALSGFDTPCVPVWDCHGLPIELNVEKKFGKPGQKLSVKEFRQKCRDYANSQVEIQKTSFKRLGVLMDWDNPCLTMDAPYEANIVRCLKTISDNGCLQQGFKPVYWCVDCSSALAEAEVEYKDKRSVAIDVRFTVVDEKDFLSRFDNLQEGRGPINVPIWTTTAWTLPASQAITLGPEIEYVLVQLPEERLIVAKKLLADLMDRLGVTDYKVIGDCLGAALENATCHHPFYDRVEPLILGLHVEDGSGTGCVHTAPAHGVEDFLVGTHYNLPVDNPVANNGCFHDSVPLVGGTHVKAVGKDIVDILIKNEKLLHEAAIDHSYPHCWRHKTPLIFRATPQWFIGMAQENLRDRAMREIKNVNWFPSWGQARIEAMIENRPDWCVSRQRTWCVPMCLIMHKETGELHPRMSELMEAIAGKIEEQGIDAWYELSLEELIGDDAKDYEKCNDGLDVWFDSGVLHTCVEKMRPEVRYPSDVCLEGSDQHRGWFNSSLLTGVALYDKAPYRDVVTHGFIVDEHGRKMSKSLGNVESPEKIMKTLGADIFRLWVASTDYTSEVSLSDEILKRTADSYRRLRNTARFLLSNLDGFDPVKDSVPLQDMLALDRYIIDKALQVQDDIVKAYNSYQFHLVYQKLHNFCVVDLGGFYLDIIKDRQYTTQADSVARRSAQTAMFHMLEALVRWLAPIASFTADEIWHYMPGERAETVFTQTWYEGLMPLAQDESMNRDFWQALSGVRDAVNKTIEMQKADGNVASAMEADVVLYTNGSLKEKLDGLGDELRFVLITSSATTADVASVSENAIDTDIDGLHVAVCTSPHEKCVRCWQRREDVGQEAEHAEICGRCVENVSSTGEVRHYA